MSNTHSTPVVVSELSLNVACD